MNLSWALAVAFAKLTLGHLSREYPHKLDHVMTGPNDAATPSSLHPIFHGSYDWHSCVHGWWQVMRLVRLFPDIPQARKIRTSAEAMLTPERAHGELAYLERPGAAGFERPYGWGWLLALHHELSLHEDQRWAEALAPLAHGFADRFMTYLPRLDYPTRGGSHGNIAFALVHALAWARPRDPDLTELIAGRAQEWFGGDRDCQAWEPDGDDFLSPALVEAVLMSRVLSRDCFAAWLRGFLPRLSEGEPATLLVPAQVSDRSDGKIAHLDGLNLSRAWCWRVLDSCWYDDHPVRPIAREAADCHLRASLPHLADDYMGEHWLASFALLALTA